MTTVSTLLSSPDFGPVYTGVIGAAQSDPAVAEALARDIIEPRVIACRTRLERARDQGQVRADADLDAAVELLYGPIYHRLLLRTRPLSPDQVTTMLGLAFGGLGPKRSRPHRAPVARRRSRGRRPAEAVRPPDRKAGPRAPARSRPRARSPSRPRAARRTERAVLREA